jgi:Domain of unknown function (DUF3883)
MPLVLVHNDVVANPVHRWNDVEGEHYHYPSKYQSKVKTGEPFVYYRGVHRDGGRRGPAEYVGAGRIADIWPDPNPGQNRRRAWYCGIEDYERFPSPVPAKIDDVNLENIPANLWRDGVRSLDADVYRRILQLASQTASGPPKASTAPNTVHIAIADSLIVPIAATRPDKNGARLTTYRKSKQAREVGDWAERVAVRFIQEQMLGCTTCVHRAAMNETPGWDIDYLDPNGVIQRVEVKGTIAAAFTGVDMTANEIDAARVHGQNYWLYLVAGCLTESPKVQAIQNRRAS